MPKAPSLKVLKKEDFIYASNCTQQLPVSVSNSAVLIAENGGSGTRTVSSESMRDRSPPKNRDNSEDGLQTFFPRKETQRQNYRTRNGKRVTKYQWDVYDFILKIPRGKVTTYKIISECIGGSARSAGGALRINPFAPYVPCHRVVASNLFIGGFCGQWAGRRSASRKSEDKEQDQIKRKVGLLKEEGIEVDKKGFLLGQESVIWRPSSD